MTVPLRLIYDTNGNLFYTVDRNGRASRFAYDRLDRVGSERWYANLNEAQTTAAAWSQMFVKSYDELGRLKRDQSFEKNAAGQTVYRTTDSYRYDGLDRVVEHSNQDLLEPGGPHSTGPAWHQTYVYAYEASGLTVTREQFLAGQFAAQTKSTYNAFGELARLTDSDVRTAGASAILDFESTDAVFSYLGDGSLASTARYTDWDAALPGGAGHRNRVQTNYAYDGAGRLKTIAHAQSRRTTAAWPANTPLVAFAYGYDAAGRINSIGTDWNTAVAGLTTRTDETQTFAFDAAGQLTGVASSDSGQNATYGYNANGNRAIAIEPGGGLDFYATGGGNRVSQDSTYSYVYDNEDGHRPSSVPISTTRATTADSRRRTAAVLPEEVLPSERASIGSPRNPGSDGRGSG